MNDPSAARRSACKRLASLHSLKVLTTPNDFGRFCVVSIDADTNGKLH